MSWTIEGCAVIYLIFIGVTLVVALFASGAQARRAQQILNRLLDTLDRLSGRGR
jgi:hypothetical protein